jgi:hypothetical protein
MAGPKCVYKYKATLKAYFLKSFTVLLDPLSMNLWGNKKLIGILKNISIANQIILKHSLEAGRAHCLKNIFDIGV